MKSAYTHEEIQDMISSAENEIETLVKSQAEALKKGEHSASASTSRDAAAQKGEGSMSSSRDTAAQKNEASVSSSRDTEAQKGEGSACAPAGVPKTTDKANGGLHKAADDPAADAGSSGALPSEGSAAPSESGNPASPASSDASGPSDPAADAPASPEELQMAYSQLSPDEQQMHMAALQAAMQASAASATPASPAAPAPSAAASPMPGPAPMPGADSPAVAPAFAKSEKLEGELTELRKSMETMGQILQVVLAKPSFKSVTGEDSMIKSEANVVSLSKSEITDRLSKRARRGLSSGDSALLKSFYKGEARVADIAHLLADK